MFNERDVNKLIFYSFLRINIVYFFLIKKDLCDFYRSSHLFTSREKDTQSKNEKERGKKYHQMLNRCVIVHFVKKHFVCDLCVVQGLF